MAAEITLFTGMSAGVGGIGQAFGKPIASHSGSFTPEDSCTMRVFANGSNVTLTIDGITWTIPNGVIEGYVVFAGVPVGVA